MIQSVSQIEKEFLLKTVVQNEQPVRFHGISTAGTGLIAAADASTMTVTLLDTFDNAAFSVCEHVTGYFDFHGKTYAFETTVRNSTSTAIKIDQPVKLLRSLQRKYVRIKRPRDIRVQFHLANEDISLDFPVCPEYISVDDFSSSTIYDGKKLSDAVGLFQSELTQKNTEQTIVMFRTKKPERFEEELLTATGKILYIPSTSGTLPKKDPYPEERIITEEIEETFEDPNYFIEGSRFDSLLTEKRADGITSEIWCPIVFYQYVVGYIYAGTRTGESFDISMVDYIWDFSRILACKLKDSGYFACDTANKTTPGHVPLILDMSPGGMLISLPKNEIHVPIREGSFFSVDIAIGKKVVHCTAKVMRRYEEKENRSYGVSFCNLAPIDMMSLYEALYRRPYAGDDPIAYEQKALNLA
jgi:c-di-GMP-binding flagellar brake protein YcgR